MKYNNIFRMRDFFMNQKLSGVFPQFSIQDLSRDVLNDGSIFEKAQRYVSDALSGTIVGDSVVYLQANSQEDALKRLNSLKSIIEGFYDNIQSITNNVKNNTKLYTTVSSIRQLQDLDDAGAKLAFFNEVQDNLNYNPDFGSANSVTSYSAIPFQRRQQEWQRKVGYRR